MNATQPTNDSFFGFATDLTVDIFSIRAQVSGANARLQQHQECDSSDELVDAKILLREVYGRLDALAQRIDEHSHRYVEKAAQAVA